MSLSANDLNRLGVGHAQKGEFAEAAIFFRKAVAADPTAADAHVNLGNVLAELGDLDTAKASYRQALRLRPNSAHLHFNFGVLLTRLEDYAEAVTSFQRAVALDANHAPAYTGLGLAHSRLNHHREALYAHRLAAQLAPHDSSVYANLANALVEAGEFEPAKAAFQRALALAANSADLHFNFGSLLTLLEDHAAAAAAFQRAVELAPSNASAHAALGIALARLYRYAEAISAFREALCLAPLDARIHSNLGLTLMKAGDYGAGLESCEVALRLSPNLPDAQCNLAVGLLAFGRLAEALAHFDAALKLKADHQPAVISRSLTLLLSGDYARGWREYDRRISDGSSVRVTHQAPLWDGSPLAGRTLLLEAEQGMGDTIQFVRYAQEIKRGHEGRIIVAVEPQLVPLLTGIAGADVLIGQDEFRPPFDVWAPLLSLPGIMKHHDPASFPACIPYLKADPVRVEKWRARLANIRGFKIGIAWQGNKFNSIDRRRSFPLTAFAPIAKLPAVTLISLQTGGGADQLAALTEFSVLDLGPGFDASGGAFMDTAAVMENLDLVITADTAIGHLAGALGRPVWLALAFSPDWRWTMHGDRTPWYPTMRLFRQPQAGDWPSVFHDIANHLSASLPPATDH